MIRRPSSPVPPVGRPGILPSAAWSGLWIAGWIATLAVGPAAWAACPVSVPVVDQLTCSSTIQGRIESSTPSNLGGSCFGLNCYTCGSPYDDIPQSRGEAAYTFECQRSGSVTLLVSGMDCDLDMYVLDDSCDPYFGCVAGSTAASYTNDSVTFTCTAGTTYTVVIEGFGWGSGIVDPSGVCSGSEGSYTLSFDVSAGTGCPEDCDNGVDDDLDSLDDCEDPDCLGDPVCECDHDDDGVDGSIGGCAGPDCDDRDPRRFPGNPELPDGIDNDCDITVDEGTIWYDDDGDGWSEIAGDCDDADPSRHPAAAEVCDGVDQDCDSVDDEGTACFDDDGDGVTEDQGDCNDADIRVFPGATEVPDNQIDDDCDGTVDGSIPDPDGDGYTPGSGDCRDTDASVYPGAPEQPDGVDNDCDGDTDEGTVRRDDDGDGASEEDGDCDDADPSIHPGAQDVANGIDDDCDGTVDEGTEVVDDDGDGFTEQAGDCDDADAGVFPGADELANGIDDDCDGTVDERDDDADADGWSRDGGDCNDADGWVNPDVPELCDGLDNDCDGTIDEDCERTAGTTIGTLRDCGCAHGGTGGLLPVLALVLLPLARRRRST